MTQDTMMTDQPTTITEAPASTVAGQVAPEAQAPATPPAETQQQQAPTDAKAGDGKEAVPEQYADFAFEEGKALDASLADDIKATSRELGLTQSQAQKLADLALKRTESAQSQQADVLTRARTEWADSAKADKEFGGDAIEANLATARKALDTFGTPELKALLNESGLGNHPEVIRFFYRSGKAISEDRFVSGRGGNQDQRDARRLYGASKMNP
jgi:hypothetical protein